MVKGSLKLFKALLVVMLCFCLLKKFKWKQLPGALFDY